jgi:hypothetical protein
VLSLRESDLSPLPADHFTEVTIPLYYEVHVYRAGSRIRVTIAAPNGTPADLELRPDASGRRWRGSGDRIWQRYALPPPAPGRAGRGSADRLAVVPGAAGQRIADWWRRTAGRRHTLDASGQFSGRGPPLAGLRLRHRSGGRRQARPQGAVGTTANGTTAAGAGEAVATTRITGASAEPYSGISGPSGADGSGSSGWC